EHRRHFPGSGRVGHHERDARVGDGADAGDRAAQGSRRDAGAGPRGVPGRSGVARHGRRWRGLARGIERGTVPAAVLPGLSISPPVLGRPGGAGGFLLGRVVVRHPAGSQRLTARPGDGADAEKSMTWHDILRLAGQAVWFHRQRSLLTMLGILIGIASVILLTSIGEGVRVYVLTEFTQFGTTLAGISPGKVQTTGLPGALGTTIHPLTVEDAVALER